MTAFRACGGDVFWLGRHYLPPEQTRTLLEILWSEAGGLRRHGTSAGL